MEAMLNKIFKKWTKYDYLSGFKPSQSSKQIKTS